jgi:cytoskeleton protein RodZ
VIPIGATLAAAREARGLDLHEAEQLTCMRVRYLIALELEHFDDLPGHAYARAFLRTYSSALGLDADRIVAEFDEQVPEPQEPTDVTPPPPRRRPRLSSWDTVPLLGVIVVLLVLVWAAWSGGGKPRRVPVAAEQAPPVVAPPTRHVATQPPPVQPVTPAATPATTPVVLRATGGPCWIEARRDGPSGPLITERLLQAGDTVRFAAKRVWLRLGAPWNVDVRRARHVVHLASTTQPVNVVV